MAGIIEDLIQLLNGTLITEDILEYISAGKEPCIELVIIQVKKKPPLGKTL